MNTKNNIGIITAIRDSIIDIYFPKHIPSVNNQLKILNNEQIVLEVMMHLDANHIRSIGLVPTEGLARGDSIIDMGHPLKIPLGKQLLGRVFNIFGETIDEKEKIKTKIYKSIYQKPLPLYETEVKSEIFETGIKAIDILAPLEKGGKSGLFGGAGDVLPKICSMIYFTKLRSNHEKEIFRRTNIKYFARRR